VHLFACGLTVHKKLVVRCKFGTLEWFLQTCRKIFLFSTLIRVVFLAMFEPNWIIGDDNGYLAH